MDAIFFANIVADTAEQFGVNWPHLIAQIISFLIVAGLLYKFAYKRIQDILVPLPALYPDSASSDGRHRQHTNAPLSRAVVPWVVLMYRTNIIQFPFNLFTHSKCIFEDKA